MSNNIAIDQPTVDRRRRAWPRKLRATAVMFFHAVYRRSVDAAIADSKKVNGTSITTSSG